MLTIRIALRDLDPQELHSRLTADGMVIFSGATIGELKSLLAGWSDLAEHPHENERGLTLITPKNVAHSQIESRGFTDRSLFVHTDRSLEPQPPSLLATVVVKPASSGGETFLVDGAEIVRTLAGEFGITEVKRLRLTRPDGQSVPVFEFCHGYCQIRFRSDEAAVPTLDGDGKLLRRMYELTSQAIPICLRAGDGYLVNNNRFLHGRTEFEGSRTIARILANVSASSPLRWMKYGFNVSQYIP